MPRSHPSEFRRKGVDLARTGDKPVPEIATDLGISESCLRNWLRQADHDGGRAPMGSAQRIELSWPSCTVSWT